MLPSELVIVRYKENRATPLELGNVPSTLELIGQLIEVFEKAVGGTRGSLQETLSLFEADETNYKQRRGLAHLLSSYYSNFEAVSPLEPEALRYKVFAEAAKSPPNPMSRRQVLETIAAQLSEGSHLVAPEEVQAGLYADLEHRALLTDFQPPEPLELLERYNLSQAQGALYRAFSLQLEIGRSSAQTYQALFKALKKQGLMYLVQGDSGSGFVVTVDGPVSLFRPSTRYGLAMAKLLPDLLKLEGWSLEATLKPKLEWNKELVEAYFTLAWDSGLKPPKRRDREESTEDLAPEDALLERFQRKSSEWTVTREVELLPLGSTVIVPDLKFMHPDGRVKYLEVLRFWEPAYLEKRLMALEGGGRDDVLLAVSERNKLEGRAALTEAHSSRVLMFKGRLDVKGVLEWLK